MIQVLAVLNQRDTDRKRPYTGEWVRKLEAMVRLHLRDPFDFAVLSDVDVAGVRRIPLEHNLPGWWAKMELFRPDLPIPEGARCLYLDLDCVVIGDLTSLILPPHGPWMTPNQRKDYPEWWADGKRGVRRYRSACMVWNHGDMRNVWTAFQSHPEGIMAAYHGDQDFIGRQFPDLRTMPAEWFENLRFCKPEYAPLGVRVVFCNPWKNHLAGRRFPWVLRAWEAHWGGPRPEGLLLEDTG
jgi:hypothetical protein